MTQENPTRHGRVKPTKTKKKKKTNKILRYCAITHYLRKRKFPILAGLNNFQAFFVSVPSRLYNRSDNKKEATSKDVLKPR